MWDQVKYPENRFSHNEAHFSSVKVAGLLATFWERAVHSVNCTRLASRKHPRTKVTPNLNLTHSKNGGNLGSESK